MRLQAELPKLLHRFEIAEIQGIKFLPCGLTVNLEGNILATMGGGTRTPGTLKVLTSDGKEVQEIRLKDGHACELAVDREGNIFQAVSGPATDFHCVNVLSPEGGVKSSFGRWESFKGTDERPLKYPGGIVVDRHGRILVTDHHSTSSRVSVFSREGKFLQVIGGSELKYARGVALDSKGNVVVVDSSRLRICVFAPDGTILRTFGTKGSGPGQFEQPDGVAVDGKGNIIVADTGNHRVQVFANDGTFLLAFGGFKSPRKVAVDHEGRILVTDSLHVLSMYG